MRNIKIILLLVVVAGIVLWLDVGCGIRGYHMAGGTGDVTHAIESGARVIVPNKPGWVSWQAQRDVDRYELYRETNSGGLEPPYELYAEPKVAKCGIERQAVKTLADKDAASIMKGPIQASTVHDLIAHQPPSKEELMQATATRFPAEKMKVELTAMVTGYKKESDLDFHIVLSDPSTGQTMIAEIPSGSCVPIEYASEFSALQKQFASDFGKPTLRYKQVTPEKVKITGIVFFDFLHGQTGVAPNGVELHPVLGWSK